ncbi:MAG: hypothetical protein MUP45_01180 [Candidatus Marinimicrobia bacterium]|nr:hypothetical protein [Candidatus Neomarinimicrobiota bacterium]
MSVQEFGYFLVLCILTLAFSLGMIAYMRNHEKQTRQKVHLIFADLKAKLNEYYLNVEAEKSG